MPSGQHVPRLDPERSRALWRAAADFDALCGLGARFLAGELAHFPGWGAPLLDAESDALQDDLVRLARAGLLTTCSQPGLAVPARALVQRSFVCGFATDELCGRLAGLERAPGLRVRVLCSDARAPEAVPVTLEQGLARVAIGGPAIEAELACFADDLRPEALADLARRAHVSAWDEHWGPSDRLWRALREIAGHPA